MQGKCINCGDLCNNFKEMCAKCHAKVFKEKLRDVGFKGKLRGYGDCPSCKKLVRFIKTNLDSNKLPDSLACNLCGRILIEKEKVSEIEC